MNTTTEEAVKATSAFENLREEVVANGGIVAVSMGRLREAAGYGRLGKYVVQEIDGKLRSHGLGHSDLSSDNQSDMVYVYVMGGEVERVLDAARNPSTEGAQKLRVAVGEGENASEVLRRIRSLLEGI
jgi:hypothetical protein